MRLTADARQLRFELVQGGARVANDLRAVVDQIGAIDAQGIDDHYRAIIIIAIGCGAAGEAGVGRLADDNDIGGVAGFDHFPLFDHIGGQHHGEGIARTKTKSGAVLLIFVWIGDEVWLADDAAQLFKQCVTNIPFRHVLLLFYIFIDQFVVWLCGVNVSDLIKHRRCVGSHRHFRCKGVPNERGFGQPTTRILRPPQCTAYSCNPLPTIFWCAFFQHGHGRLVVAGHVPLEKVARRVAIDILASEQYMRPD